jgi:hypothetical protein
MKNDSIWIITLQNRQDGDIEFQFDLHEFFK